MDRQYPYLLQGWKGEPKVITFIPRVNSCVAIFWFYLRVGRWVDSIHYCFNGEWVGHYYPCLFSGWTAGRKVVGFIFEEWVSGPNSICVRVG